MSCPSYEDAIHRTGILDLLAPFDPHVVGTLPLGIALPASDIDIVCHAPDLNEIADLIWQTFRSAKGFVMYRWVVKGRPLIAQFEAEGWPFEIFAAADPVEDQAGWRHFKVEQRLLGLAGSVLHDRIMMFRMQGLKTEPAFAAALGLAGGPYESMNKLCDATDKELVEVLATPAPHLATAVRK
ncbi:DUF4269 domain-containing protein [Rhodopseudomonas boonkerdii]|nr:DUF4269 domain-containing protein [Rhodopseudomonas boonkerdii]